MNTFNRGFSYQLISTSLRQQKVAIHTNDLLPKSWTKDWVRMLKEYGLKLNDIINKN